MTAEPLTIVLDESGTAGVANQPFVTAGVAIRGDAGVVAHAWSSVCEDQSFPIKGTKYSRRNFLALVDFLLHNSVFPISSSHTLSSENAKKLRLHCADLVNHKKPTGLQKLGYAHYIWTRHLIGTIGHSLVSIILHLGPFDRLLVAVDKYKMTPEMSDFVTSQFHELFHRDGGLMQCLNRQAIKLSHIPIAAAMVEDLKSGFQVRGEDIEIDLNSKGPLNRLADAVAALMRQRALKPNAAKDAWEVLNLAYQNRTVIDVDTTDSIVNGAIPWSTFE